MSGKETNVEEDLVDDVLLYEGGERGDNNTNVVFLNQIAWVMNYTVHCLRNLVKSLLGLVVGFQRPPKLLIRDEESIEPSFSND